MEVHDLSNFIREGFRERHQDIKYIAEHYCSKKFKVTNKELKRLKDEYYINLAKDKLNVI
jgi:DNA-binding NtrC family response regulator